jgi:hypothetical protein
MLGEPVPEIKFEHCVFDHNYATAGAAFFINGRPETMSAISLVVDGCLFFRNFYDHTGVFRVNNIWPLTAVITDSDLFEVRPPVHTLLQLYDARECDLFTSVCMCARARGRILDSTRPSPSTGGHR